jgi:hypothetical protein
VQICDDVSSLAFSAARRRNTDAMLGIGYAFTPYAKVSLNYRVDAYFNAMRAFDINGNVVNVNRVYHGPNLRLTLTY